MFAAFAIAAVSSMAQVKYTISGTYDANGKKIYLKDELTEKNIDSTLVAEGKFSFTGTADKDALMAVKTQKGNLAMEFFNDGTPVIVNFNDSTLKGSPLNERLAKLNHEMEAPQRRIDKTEIDLLLCPIFHLHGFKRTFVRTNHIHVSTR